MPYKRTRNQARRLQKMAPVKTGLAEIQQDQGMQRHREDHPLELVMTTNSGQWELLPTAFIEEPIHHRVEQRKQASINQPTMRKKYCLIRGKDARSWNQSLQKPKTRKRQPSDHHIKLHQKQPACLQENWVSGTALTGRGEGSQNHQSCISRWVPRKKFARSKSELLCRPGQVAPKAKVE